MQSERVAAWRELARRLAHELKNPLFPLQLTVENLVRARQLPAAEFDEVFSESTQTLSMEIANLKKIIGRFSDFSKMPKPELERIDAKDVVERVRALYAIGAAKRDRRSELETEVDDRPMPLMVDPELLHRALSNLVLNANGCDAGGWHYNDLGSPRRRCSRTARVGYRPGNDAGGMRAALHSVLHDQAARNGVGAGHCAVGGSGP